MTRASIAGMRAAPLGAGLGACVLLVSGCALFETQRIDGSEAIDAQVPQAWYARSVDGALEDGWLRQFDSAQLQALVDEGLGNNASLFAAMAQRDALLAKREIEIADTRPRAELQAGAQRQKAINDFLGDSSAIPREVLISRIRIGVGVSWELDVWNRAFDLRSAAVEEVLAASEDVEAARDSLAAQIANQWFRLLAADRRVALAEAVAENRSHHAGVQRERYDLGLTTAGLAQQAEIDSSRAQVELAARRLDRTNAARALEVLLGRYPAADIAGEAGLPVVPEPLAGDVPSTLLERRPDVVAAERRLLAASDRLGAAKKNLLPRFSINLSGGTQAKYRDLLFDEDSFIWALGGGVLQPLFLGGRIQAGIRAQEAALFEALNRYREKVFNAFREVEDALAAEASLREQRRHLMETLISAEAAQQNAEERFDSGSVDAEGLLAARLATLQTRQRLLDVNLALLSNRVGLNLALGVRPQVDVANEDAMPAASDDDGETPVDDAVLPDTIADSPVDTGDSVAADVASTAAQESVPSADDSTGLPSALQTEADSTMVDETAQAGATTAATATTPTTVSTKPEPVDMTAALAGAVRSTRPQANPVADPGPGWTVDSAVPPAGGTGYPGYPATGHDWILRFDWSAHGLPGHAPLNVGAD